MIVHKVVRKLYNGSWVSVSPYLRDNQVTYHLGAFVRPKLIGSRLFVLDTLEHAREFITENRFAPTNYTVLRCETPRVFDCPFKMVPQASHAHIVWEAVHDGNMLTCPQSLEPIPECTVMVDSLRVIEEVVS